MDELGPSFGRVFFEGLVLCGFLLAGFSYYHSPGFQGTRWTLVPELLLRVLVIYPVTQAVWMVVVALIWNLFGRKGGRGQAVTLLLPLIVGTIVLLWHLATNPPSPQAHFRRYFPAELPADAHDVGVKSHHLHDTGKVIYYFRCSKESTRHLVQLLKAKEVPPEIGADWLTNPSHWKRELFFGFKDIPDPESWNNRHYFEGRQGETGTGYFVITNETMTEVFVSRVPLATKTDAELGPEAVEEMNVSRQW